MRFLLLSNLTTLDRWWSKTRLSAAPDAAPKPWLRHRVLCHMRRALAMSVGVAVVLGCAVASSEADSATLSPPSGPAVSKIVPHWHQLVDGIGGVAAASNRYVVLDTPGDEKVGLSDYTLLNARTDHRTPVITPDACPNAADASLGGPYLAVQCQAASGSGGVSVDLLELSTGRWSVHVLSPSVCAPVSAGCELEAVGSTWIRFTASASPGQSGLPAYLQNISTGTVRSDGTFVVRSPDSAGASDRSPDSLDDASGVSHPCVRLPSGSFDEDFLGVPYGPAGFLQLGHFILTTSGYPYEGQGATSGLHAVLRSCLNRSRLQLPADLIATPSMLVWPTPADDVAPGSLEGRFLPTLRRFAITNNKGQLAAASANTIFETVLDPGTGTDTLWATAVPAPDG